MKQIIGICGAIGSGKTTFAEILTKLSPNHLHLETGTVVAEICNEYNKLLKVAMADSTPTKPIELANKALKELIPAIEKIAGRKVTQKELLIDETEAMTQPEWYIKLFTYLTQIATQPSLLDQEVNPASKETYRPLMQWLGGYLLLKIDPLLWFKETIRRTEEHPDIELFAVTAVRQPAEADYLHQLGGKVVLVERPNIYSDDTDVTERRRFSINHDVKIHNNDNLEGLQIAAVDFLDDLRNDRLQPDYFGIKPA